MNRGQAGEEKKTHARNPIPISLLPCLSVLFTAVSVFHSS